VFQQYALLIISDVKNNIERHIPGYAAEFHATGSSRVATKVLLKQFRLTRSNLVGRFAVHRYPA
jgi:hypothetical protein